MRVRRLTVAVGMLVVAVGSSACAGKEPTFTPIQSRDGVVAFVKGTTDQLGMTGWWPRNGVVGADPCRLGGGKDGAEYSYDSFTAAGTDHLADAARVAKYWESLGMKVSIERNTQNPVVYASGGPVRRSSFDTGANNKVNNDSYRVGAVMPCVPGDWHELNEKDQADRDAGKVLPGDEGVVPVPDPRDRPLTPPPPGPPLPSPSTPLPTP